MISQASELGLPLKIVEFWRNINKWTIDLIKELFQRFFFLFSLRE